MGKVEKEERKKKERRKKKRLLEAMLHSLKNPSKYEENGEEEEIVGGCKFICVKYFFFLLEITPVLVAIEVAKQLLVERKNSKFLDISLETSQNQSIICYDFVFVTK